MGIGYSTYLWLWVFLLNHTQGRWYHSWHIDWPLGWWWWWWWCWWWWWWWWLWCESDVKLPQLPKSLGQMRWTANLQIDLNRRQLILRLKVTIQPSTLVQHNVTRPLTIQSQEQQRTCISLLLPWIISNELGRNCWWLLVFKMADRI